jgi:hypothetical protein
MELIAVDVAGIAIAATCLAMCAIAVLAFFVHERLLQRAVERASVESLARRRQAIGVKPDSVTHKSPDAALSGVVLRERRLKTRRAGTPARDPSAECGSLRSPERALS